MKPSKSGIGSDQVIEFLLQPTAYTEPTTTVSARETHLSWLFFTDTQVFKLKKPLHTRLIDWRSPDTRRHYCLEEVRLNRRLAHNVYLGVIAVGTARDGSMRLGEGVADVLDWLVVMRRLPAEREFRHLLQNGKVGMEELMLVARRLSRFYLNQPSAPLRPADYHARLRSSIESTAAALARAAPDQDVNALATAQADFLRHAQESFAVRVRTGRIVEGHGDLRPEHIYLMQQAEIIDCLEFSRELRTNDIADELAFLGMECERLGAAWIAPALFQTYTRQTGDTPPAALCRFFMSYRALIWARLAAEHPHAGEGRWQQRIRDYLALARRQLDAATELPLSATF